MEARMFVNLWLCLGYLELIKNLDCWCPGTEAQMRRLQSTLVQITG